MGRKKTPGLFLRNGVWHIDKQIRGSRLCESTGSGNLKEAESYLARRIEELRQARVYGVRPNWTFRQAATKYLVDNEDKATIATNALFIRQLDPFIGELPLKCIHMGTLQQFIKVRRQDGVKTKTINLALSTVRRIVNLAGSEWLDDNGLTWLDSVPKIKMLPVRDARKPYPLSWEEQTRLFKELPNHLAEMALFKVNTGCRQAEICQLRWQWEANVPELNSSVFIIPAEHVKNREERLIVLNRVAKSVIDSVRGRHPTHVFTYCGHPIGVMNNSGWKSARRRAGLTQVRVHDLKHTFGRRLRAAGVSFEDRQDLLGHRSGRITTHYSAAELQSLLAAANSVCNENSRKSPAMVVLRSKAVA